MPATREADLVIFDCDGVLIDSEPLACRLRAEQLTDAGYPISADDVMRRFVGRSERDLRHEVEAELGHKLPPDRHDEELRALFARELRPVAGIAALLDDLRAVGAQCCVASSSSPAKLEYALGLVGLWSGFHPHVFSAHAVARGKPAPDIFLHAAAEMGVAPARCIVVEDSVAGVGGGRAAGMRVLGFCGGSHCRAGHAAGLVAAGAEQAFADAAALGRVLLAAVRAPGAVR